MRRAFAAAAGLGLILWAAVRVDRAPRLDRGSSDRFSEARARTQLRRLIGGIASHPVGSSENRRIADRLVETLAAMGYRPERQRAFVCGDFRRSCGEVENVIATAEGSASTGEIVLNSHYDSVPASPGASDSMAGVAALLEIARDLKTRPPGRNTVLFVFADGEEAGLLGSTAFVNAHPAGRIRVVVNLEARGSRGPSLLAETSGPASGVLLRFAAKARGPFADSAVTALTALLPNANDLEEYRRTGAVGLMFGFVQGFRQYHSSTDTAEALSPETLGQHGQNALDALQALRNEDLGALPRGPAGFTTIVGKLIVWPLGAALPAALAAFAVSVGAVLIRRRREGMRIRDVAAAAGWIVVSMALAGLVSLLTMKVMRAVAASPTPWKSRLEPDYLAGWAGAVLISIAVAGRAARRRGVPAFWSGSLLVWSVLALVLSVTAPAASHLLSIPALFGGALALLPPGRSPSGVVDRSLLTGVAAGLLVAPRMQVLLDLGGMTIVPLLAVFAAGIASFFVPAWCSAPRRRILPAAALLWAAAIGAAAAVPAFTPNAPQALSLAYARDADSGAARWVSSGSPLPGPLRAAARWTEWRAPFDWLGANETGPSASAPALALPPPRFDVRESTAIPGGREVSGKLWSPRGAPVVYLAIPAGVRVEGIRIGGQSVPPDLVRRRLFAPGWEVAIVWTVPPEGIDLRIRLGQRGPAEITLADRSRGLPPEGAGLAAARGAAAAPNYFGDSTLVETRRKI